MGASIRQRPPRRAIESISVIAGPCNGPRSNRRRTRASLISVVAGPRFERATEAPANGFRGRPVDHCFSAHGARNSTPELARFLTRQAKDTSAILAGIPHGYL